MKAQKFSLSDRFKSFQYAIAGVITFLQREHNSWFHLLATVSVVVAAAITGVSKTDVILLVFAIGFVWVTEIINTCIERIMDFISVEEHIEIKFIKDLSAGAVLIASVTALIIGLLVFIPKFW